MNYKDNNGGQGSLPEDLIVEVNGRKYAAPSMDRLKRYLRDYYDVTEPARKLAVESMKYYDGDQVPNRFVKKLDAMGLPSKSINKVRQSVNANISILLNQKTVPEAYPRTSAAADAADVATKMLRYAVDKSEIKKKRSGMFQDYVISGITAVLIGDDDDSIPVTPIAWKDFIYDPRSCEYDFSDAEYLGMAKWLSPNKVRSMFPESMERLGITSSGDLTTIGEGFKDSVSEWMNEKDRTILVAEIHFKVDNTWVFATFCHAGLLDLGNKGYMDDDSKSPKSLCPILAQSCYVKGDPEGNHDRYGMIKDLMPLQDEYVSHKAMANFAARDRRVQLVDVNLGSQYKKEQVRAEANKTDGVLYPGWQTVPSTQFGEFSSLLQLSDREFQANTPGPEALGLAGSSSQSGISRQVGEQQGLTKIGPVLHRISDFETRIYENMWYRIRQFWNDELEIRITGNKDAPEFLKINVPIVEQVERVIAGPDGQPIIQRGAEVTAVEHEVARMFMDIKVDVVQENPTVEHEAWETIMRYTQGIPPGSPEWLIAVEMAPSFPGKRDKLEQIKQKMDEQQKMAAQAQAAQMEQAAQAQQAAAQSQMAKDQADIESKQAGARRELAMAEKYQADANKTHQDNVITALYGPRN